MLDFGPAAARHPGRCSDTLTASSTTLASTLGMAGEWSVGPSAEALRALGERSVSIEISRLAVRDDQIDFGSRQVSTAPAVRGATVWSNDTRACRVVSQPNLVGCREELASLEEATDVAVVIDPALCGPIRLPPNTSVVFVLLEGPPIAMTPGRATVVGGEAAALARLGEEGLVAVAHGNRRRARLLAKHVNQIGGVSVVGGEPETGRFVLSTPFAGSEVLASMRSLGVEGGIALEFPEYPAGIAVTCGSHHTDADLGRYGETLAEAYADRLSVIGSEGV